MNGFIKKMDVLDFIIEVWREHEKALDAAIYRLEAVADRLGTPHIR